MTQAESRITTTIPLDGEGRLLGHYRIPFSDDTQPYGHVGPLCVLANGAGPTLVLTGGVHGDEYAGPVALMRLAHGLDLGHLAGRGIAGGKAATHPVRGAAQREADGTVADQIKADPVAVGSEHRPRIGVPSCVERVVTDGVAGALLRQHRGTEQEHADPRC